MKYTLLLIIALIGCSDNPVAPMTNDKGEVIKSPYEWCSEEKTLTIDNIDNFYGLHYEDCETPVTKDLYDSYYSYECYGAGACNPRGGL